MKINKILFGFVAGFLLLGNLQLNNMNLESARMAVSAENNQTENTVLSPSLSDGMQQFSFDEIKDKRVTLRQPTMEVLERDLPRTAPKILSDTFYLPNFSTRENTKAGVTFKGYPASVTPGYALTNFEKYMLMREVIYYNQYAMADSEAGTLKKHPAADGQYGALPVLNNAIKKRIVMDSSYKSHLTTGLYMPAGEVITVKVEGLKQGESIRLVTNLQSTGGWVVGDDANKYYNTYDNLIIAESEKAEPNYESLDIPLHSQYARGNELIPAIATSFTFTENKTYKVGCPFGGSLFLKPVTLNSSPEIIITGAVETPHFILGVTSKEYFETYCRTAPGLISSLDTENCVMAGPAVHMKNADDIEKVAYLWHSIMSINTSFNGKAYNTETIVKFNFFIPAGAAVAIGNNAVCPSGWMAGCMKYNGFINSGSWGVLHEIGHIHASTYGRVWGMNGSQEGEVRNNTLIVLTYTLLLNMDTRMVGVEHGEVTTPYTALRHILNSNTESLSDYNNYEYFQALSLYSNLIHFFGPEKFIEFFYTYKTDPSYCDNKRADFAYRMAIVNNHNIVPFINEYYKANITNEMFSAEQLKFINSLTNYYPIALSFGNGINNLETSRRQEISFYNSKTFDFENAILCPIEFEILGFEKPKYGTISINNKQVTYTPPKNLVEGDEFSVKVKMANNEIVYLPVRFWFQFNSSVSQIWKDIKTNTMEKAIEFSNNNKAASIETENAAGKKTFNYGNVNSYVKSNFSFVASVAGKHKFYLKSDDSASLYAGTLNEPKKFTLNNSTYTPNYNKNNFFEVDLKIGEAIIFETHLLNVGGQGFLNVGVNLPSANNNETITDVSTKNIYHPNFDLLDITRVKDYGWQPKFYSSIKNFLKTTYISKAGWSILEAPVAQGGSDKQSLIDNNNNTIYHSKYTPASGITPMPHNYVVDMGTVNRVNSFEVVTRNNVNSYINKYQLLGSLDNVNYHVLSEGDKLAYSGLTATIKFAAQDVRYFKLVAITATGGNFTVIAELNAGISGSVQNIVMPDNKNIISSGFIKANQNNELIAKQKNAVFKFSFNGTGFSVYSNTEINGGSANVIIDGENFGTINLSDSFAINKLAFTVQNLDNAKHNVEIITENAKTFHIGYLSLNYGEKLEQLTNANKPENKINSTLLVLIIVVSVCATITILLMIASALNKRRHVSQEVKPFVITEQLNMEINKTAKPEKSSGEAAKLIINKKRKK